jgi:DNA-binding response OmpR family regulator
MRVLVVEDEPKVAEALRSGLAAEHYDVVVERTGDGAFLRVTTEPFDVVLLDLGLPDRDGLDVLAAVRRRHIQVPVVVLTARDAIKDRVAGLDASADDYLVKPFAFAELLARIRALVRRGRDSEEQMRVGPLRIDLRTRKVRYGEEPIDLTVKEFDVLCHLMRHQGQVVSRESIARDVWQEPARSTPLDNVIDVHIARIRRKVERAESHKLIHTIRGVGFMVHVDEP